ncbi:MAG: transcription factor S, partial [Thermoplasmata archaeon]
MFCPKCKSLMFPKNGKWVCSRCAEIAVPQKKNMVIMETAREHDTLVITENLDTLPKTKIACPKCNHNEAYWVIRQTRAADEP